MALGRDPSIEFAKSLVDRFVQFKSLQFQQDLLKRKEQRYDTQLQENRLHRQRQLTRSDAYLGLAERRTIATEQGKLGTNIKNVFGGSERKHLFDSAVNALRGIDVDEKGLIFKDRSVSRENIQNRFDEYKDDIGFDSFDTEQQKTQAITNFNRAVRTLGSELKVEIDWDVNALTDTTQPPSPKRAPEAGVFQGAQSSEPTRRPAGFLGRSESEFPAGFERPKGLESIWKQLSEEEKTTARTYIKNGGSPQAIIDIFESSKQLK